MMLRLRTLMIISQGLSRPSNPNCWIGRTHLGQAQAEIQHLGCCAGRHPNVFENRLWAFWGFWKHLDHRKFEHLQIKRGLSWERDATSGNHWKTPTKIEIMEIFCKSASNSEIEKRCSDILSFLRFIYIIEKTRRLSVWNLGSSTVAVRKQNQCLKSPFCLWMSTADHTLLLHGFWTC